MDAGELAPLLSVFRLDRVEVLAVHHVSITEQSKHLIHIFLVEAIECFLPPNAVCNPCYGLKGRELLGLDPDHVVAPVRLHEPQRPQDLPFRRVIATLQRIEPFEPHHLGDKGLASIVRRCP